MINTGFESRITGDYLAGSLYSKLAYSEGAKGKPVRTRQGFVVSLSGIFIYLLLFFFSRCGEVSVCLFVFFSRNRLYVIVKVCCAPDKLNMLILRVIYPRIYNKKNSGSDILCVAC